RWNQSRRRAGRTARPDRAEWLRQVDAGELHLRHADEREWQRDVRWQADEWIARAPAHDSRARPIVPASAPVPFALRRREPARAAALCREGASRLDDLVDRA